MVAAGPMNAVERVEDRAAASLAALGDLASLPASGPSQVSDSAAALADSAVREGKNLQNSAAHSASEIADIVIAKLKGAGLNTDTLISQAKDHASNIQNSIESEIRARPLRTLGYAALAGIVFGLIASR